jgi:hypothetical protein
MYIKHRNIKDNKIIIINVNISSSKDIVVEDNYLIINMEKESDTVKILLENNEYAKLAQEKVFITLGLKAPYNNILDLTNVDSVNSYDMVGITLQDVANKFKVNLNDLAIVGSPKFQKVNLDEVTIDEEEGLE